MYDRDVILCCSNFFTDCSQADLAAGKDAKDNDNRGTFIEVAYVEVISTEDACDVDNYIRDVDIRNTCIRDAYVEESCTRGTSIRVACIETSYVKGRNLIS